MSNNRTVRFTKYLHDDSSVSENIEHFYFFLNKGEVNVPEGISPEELKEAVENLFENRPWYEIGITVELNIDTGEVKLVGIK